MVKLFIMYTFIHWCCYTEFHATFSVVYWIIYNYLYVSVFVLSDGLTIAHVGMSREALIACQVNCFNIKGRSECPTVRCLKHGKKFYFYLRKYLSSVSLILAHWLWCDCIDNLLAIHSVHFVLWQFRDMLLFITSCNKFSTRQLLLLYHHHQILLVLFLFFCANAVTACWNTLMSVSYQVTSQ
jgi:hypothetical protein